MASTTWASIPQLDGTVQKQPTITRPDGYKEQLPVFPDIPTASLEGLSIEQSKYRPNDRNLDPVLRAFSLFVCYMWYEYRQRRMTREEVMSMMNMVFHTSYQELSSQFKRSDNPTDPNTIAFQGVGDELKALWTLQADIWFGHLRESDSVAKARAETLLGFIGRVPDYKPSGGKRLPTVNMVRLEPYQVYEHYGVVNWCTDREGNSYTESSTRPIFAHHYKFANRKRMILSAELLDPNTQIAKDLAPLIENERCKPFFTTLAEKIANKYEVEELKLEPRFDTGIASQSDPIPTTTAEFGTMTIGATSGASTPFGSMVDWNPNTTAPEISDEGEEAEAQEKGKGKEKARAAPSSSSSNSPEGKDSEKGKKVVKKPRVSGSGSGSGKKK